MRRSKKTGYTSFDVFKEDLYNKTVDLLRKGYVPSYLDGTNPTIEDVKRQIKSITEEQYNFRIAGIKERAEDAGRVEKNANRALISEMTYDVSAAQARSISKMFKETFGLKVKAQDIRINAKDPNWEHWDKYKELYHKMRDEGFTVGEIQSLIWGS